MPLRKVDGGIYVTGEGQFIISLTRSGRRAFLVSDDGAQRYVRLNDRLKLAMVAVLVVTFGGAALKLFSPFWIVCAAIIGFAGHWWLQRDVSEKYPPLSAPEVIAEIAARNEGAEPAWFPLLSVAIFAVMEWTSRHPAQSRSLNIAMALVVILSIVEFAMTTRAHAAHQSDRPSSQVTH
jgi:hypothetical protein